MKQLFSKQYAQSHRPNQGKQLPVDILLVRREISLAPVPDGVTVLTAGIDTQDDRFEIEVIGWSKIQG